MKKFVMFIACMTCLLATTDCRQIARGLSKSASKATRGAARGAARVATHAAPDAASHGFTHNAIRQASDIPIFNALPKAEEGAFARTFEEELTVSSRNELSNYERQLFEYREVHHLNRLAGDIGHALKQTNSDIVVFIGHNDNGFLNIEGRRVSIRDIDQTLKDQRKIGIILACRSNEYLTYSRGLNNAVTPTQAVNIAKFLNSSLKSKVIQSEADLNRAVNQSLATATVKAVMIRHSKQAGTVAVAGGMYGVYYVYFTNKA